MEDGIAVMVSLIGAAIGGLGGTFVGYFLQERRRKQQINELVTKQYLSQFQHFSESLWFRLHNIMFRGGSAVMKDDYFLQTTLYALASFLAYKWIMTLEGIYAQIELIDLRLDPKIKEDIHNVGGNLDDIAKSLGAQMYYYDRRSLAESVLEKKDGIWMVSKFIDFQKNYFGEGNHVEINAGKDFVMKLGKKRPEGETKRYILKFMDEIAEIVIELTNATKIPAKDELKNKA
mgnify:CR=1 FL=1